MANRLCHNSGLLSEILKQKISAIQLFSFIFSLGTTRSVRPLSPASEAKIVQLLCRMEQFYLYHGINLRTCYEDFDRHHMGVVTESQVRISELAS